MALDDNTKRCPKCGETKPRTGFYRSKQTKDGLHGHCKTCMSAHAREWNAANAERARENRRRYYEADPQRSLERDRRNRKKRGPTYSTWAAMKARCATSTHPAWEERSNGGAVYLLAVKPGEQALEIGRVPFGALDFDACLYQARAEGRAKVYALNTSPEPQSRAGDP